MRGNFRKPADRGQPARVAKFRAVFIECFDDAVGEKNQRVAGMQIFRGSFVCGRGNDSERHAADVESFHVAIGAPQNRRIVTRIHVAEAPRSGFVLGENRGGEAEAIEAVRARVAIQAQHQIRERCPLSRDGAQARLQRRHEQCGGDAFSGDVGDYQRQFAAVRGAGRAEKSVVVIAGHGILRARRKRDFRAGNFRRKRGHQPGLNLARDFQIAFHRNFVGQFQGEKKKEKRCGEEFKFYVQGETSNLQFDAGQKQHDQCAKQKYAPRRR